MFEGIHHSIGLFQSAWDWLVAQPPPVQVVIGAVGLAVIWVLWILLRVILAAFRGAFRGL